MRQATSRLAAITILLTLVGCSGSDSQQQETQSEDTQPREVTGACADMYGAQTCTYAKMEGQDVVEVGMVLPVSAVENAPAEGEMEWPPVRLADLSLPEEAVAGLGINHLSIYWEPHGHPPGPYLYPHFDFHFYSIPPAETNAIDCTNEAKPSVLPAGYVLPDVEEPAPVGKLVGICVPGMGMHALLESEMNSTEPFTGTMVIGYYDSSPIFVEPMITSELLMRRESFTLDMPAVQAPDGVRYPTKVRGDYDAATDAYHVVLTGF